MSIKVIQSPINRPIWSHWWRAQFKKLLSMQNLSSRKFRKIGDYLLLYRSGVVTFDRGSTHSPTPAVNIGEQQWPFAFLHILK